MKQKEQAEVLVESPSDLDPECLKLYAVLNQFEGINTISSCCGHGKDEYQFFFQADSFDAIAQLSYAIDVCHSGVAGWRIKAWTDCAAQLSFILEGPADPSAGDELAVAIGEGGLLGGRK